MKFYKTPTFFRRGGLPHQSKFPILRALEEKRPHTTTPSASKLLNHYKFERPKGRLHNRFTTLVAKLDLICLIWLGKFSHYHPKCPW